MAKAVVPSSIVFEVLDQYNYEDWSETVEAYLKAQDLWDVAALHAIRISCGTNALPYIKGIREAKEAWLCLKVRFGNPPSFPNNRRNLYRVKVIQRSMERSIADEENVDHEFKEAYKDWVDASSKSNLSAAIARCLAQMVPGLLFCYGAHRLAPLAAAIGSHMNEMANMLYVLTPQDFWDDAQRTATVITKSFEAENLDIALKLIQSRPEEFILIKDIFGNSPLCAAARAHHLFRCTYHHPFLSKYICKVLGPRLPLGSINFKISRMDFLIHLGKVIGDSSTTHSQEKIDIISEAFFEAIQRENFNFILMLINFLKPIVHFTNNKERNMYMVAIAHRCAKLLSYFWDKRDEAYLDPSLSFDELENNLLHMVGASTPPIAHDRISKPALLMKRELMWFKEVENLVPELVRKLRNRDF